MSQQSNRRDVRTLAKDILMLDGIAPSDSVQAIPYVGPAMARDLNALGYNTVGDLVDQDPMDLYNRVCEHQGGYVDRCVLYVLRSAVYMATDPDPEPELMQWWKWKGKEHLDRSELAID